MMQGLIVKLLAWPWDKTSTDSWIAEGTARYVYMHGPTRENTCDAGIFNKKSDPFSRKIAQAWRKGLLIEVQHFGVVGAQPLTGGSAVGMKRDTEEDLRAADSSLRSK
jgi:hypothetical protein